MASLKFLILGAAAAGLFSAAHLFGTGKWAGVLSMLAASAGALAGVAYLAKRGTDDVINGTAKKVYGIHHDN